VLEPGDMLYLPPRWAHDGVAVGECMTYSIGFRQPARGELARELLQRLAEDAEDAAGDAVYRDPGQPAVESPGGIPPGMMDFARDALQAVLNDPQAMARVLGEYLTEPKASVWFDAGHAPRTLRGVVLDRRTRMMHDARHIFINGESYRRSGARVGSCTGWTRSVALATAAPSPSAGWRCVNRCRNGWAGAARPSLLPHWGCSVGCGRPCRQGLQGLRASSI
jgi:50S ribosomal protein L16 3-hydroxylase